LKKAGDDNLASGKIKCASDDYEAAYNASTEGNPDGDQAALDAWHSAAATAEKLGDTTCKKDELVS
jgi:hypothetical protein